MDKERKPSLERAAILLALTETREEEEELRKSLSELFDIRCAVTGLGGTVANLRNTGKLTNTVMSTAFNTGIIPKEARMIHALIHATSEASNSVFTHTNSNASLALKIGLTTNFKWLAVAIYGRSSLHPLLEHARIGLGVMHL
ncbi:MAG TPA: HutP family protein [Desulfosporosinus sp.]|nr:HutP family protein [Desulfosporosinus sp.]